MNLTELLPIFGAIVLCYVGIVNSRTAGAAVQTRQAEAITSAWLDDRAEILRLRKDAETRHTESEAQHAADIAKINDLDLRARERHDAINEATGRAMEAERLKLESDQALKEAQALIKELETENAALKIALAEKTAQLAEKDKQLAEKSSAV
jgi:transaldolase